MKAKAMNQTEKHNHAYTGTIAKGQANLQAWNNKSEAEKEAWEDLANNAIADSLDWKRKARELEQQRDAENRVSERNRPDLLHSRNAGVRTCLELYTLSKYARH